MEKIFKTRWWDYSDKRFNLNGRICLETMVPFGFLGCLVVCVINPFIVRMLSSVNETIMLVIVIVLLITFIVDNILSFKIIFNFRSTITNAEADATEEITRKVREVFVKRGMLKKRLVNAFPTMKSGRERLMELKKRIENDMKKMK